MGDAYFLTTARLGFRSWRASDLDLAVGLWGDPDVTKFTDARARLSDDEVRQRLAEEIATERSHRVQYWPVFLLDAGDHVGCCGLRPYVPAEQAYELGVHIRSASGGTGTRTRRRPR